MSVIEGEPTAILASGLANGTSRVTFIDVNNNTEIIDLAVAAQPAGEKAPPPPPPVKTRSDTIAVNVTKRISMSTGALIEKVNSDNPKVIRVNVLENEPNVILVTGLSSGLSRVTLTDGKNNSEVIEFTVPSADLEAKRLEMVAIINKTVPTASVIVTLTPSNAIVISGVVTDAEQGKLLLEIARNTFTLGADQQGNPIPAQVIPAFRIGGLQTVQLEVVVAVVNRSEVRNMAFNFVSNGNRYVFNSILGAPLNFANLLAVAPAGANGSLAGSPNLSFGLISDNHSFTGYLNALRTEGLAKFHTDSRVTTQSGKEGQLVSGGEVPILTGSGLGNSTVTYKPFGSVVRYLPVVLGDGKIYLQVEAELSNRNDANNLFIPGANTLVPGFDTRQAKASVTLEDGQTLAIGGLIQNRINATTRKVPILGDTPVIGAAFRDTTFNEIEEELLILVTPRLVDGVACTQIPKYLPGRETRSADDFELFLEGILEAPRGPRNVGHPYQGAHKLSGGIYPCAAPGGCATGNCPTGQCATGLSTAVHTHGALGSVDPIGSTRVVTAPQPTPAPFTVSTPTRETEEPLGQRLPPTSATPTQNVELPPMLPPVSLTPETR
jgi:pilus assembly protein CpaC